MKSLKNYIAESKQYFGESLDENIINEALMILGKNKKDNNYGNVIIFAGGAGSGKGWIRKNLLGTEGIVMDVDAWKEMAMKSKKIKAKVKDEFDVDLNKLNLRNPVDVSRLHNLLSDELHLGSKKNIVIAQSVMAAHPDRKPNIIFDVTLKDFGKLMSISREALDMGYDINKIHLIWVVNDVEIASKQNANRDRVVDDVLLRNIHQGVANTMKDILKYSENTERYANGTYYIAFNKKDIDSTVLKSAFGGSYISEANYVKIKDSGKRLDSSKITAEMRRKMNEYTQTNNF